MTAAPEFRCLADCKDCPCEVPDYVCVRLATTQRTETSR